MRLQERNKYINVIYLFHGLDRFIILPAPSIYVFTMLNLTNRVIDFAEFHAFFNI